jgi:hypothetical protein
MASQIKLAILLALGSLAGCHARTFVTLPDGANSVNVNLNLSASEWTVTVQNEHGSASTVMFAANDHQRSNLYLSPRGQLIVIEQGGSDSFFKISKDKAPEALDGEKYKEADGRSANWRYFGVIVEREFIGPDETPECIALLGIGKSPYREKYQVPDFC